MISESETCLFCLVQRIQYAKAESDLIAKLKGTYVERPRREKEKKAKKEKKYDSIFSICLNVDSLPVRVV